MKKKVLASLLLTLSSLAWAGTDPSAKPFAVSGDIFGLRVFVENKGQFDRDLSVDDKVYYAYINGKEKMYFTQKGVVHMQDRSYPLTENQRDAMERGEHIFPRDPDIFSVYMSWANANPNVQIESSEKQSHYLSYWSANLISHTYKKITYKEIYPNIDIEYIIPSDKEFGVKYNVIMRPGANLPDIKMVYSGDLQKVKLNKTGEIVIKTPLEDITEHAPKSFYSDGQPLASSFKLNGNTVSFNLPQNYDNTKTVVIDPWITTITTVASNNSAYDVDYDNSGNVYVYGGSQSCKIAKYTSAGVLIWTWAGTIAAVPSWNSAGISNFVVMRSTSKSYAGQGVAGGGARIIRLDANGVYDNLITNATPSWNEVWDMAFHCSTGNVYGMGGSTASNQSAGILDQLTGTLVPIAFVTANITPPNPSPGLGYDVACHAIDDAGDFFWIYASSFTPPLSNKIAKINAAFTASVWIAPSTFTTLQEYANKGAYLPNPGSSNGYNCLAVNMNYLYFYDGYNVAAYNKANGAIIASTTITAAPVAPTNSFTLKKVGGISVDDCNNLYLGGMGNIYCLNFNGTNFTTRPTIPLGGNSTTLTHVYDIKMERLTKTLFVSGQSFVGTYSATTSNSCAPLNIICYNPNPVDYVICAGTQLTLTPINYLNLTNTTYSLNPGNLTSNTGTFILTPTANISYTTYISGTYTNTPLTLTAVANVTVNTAPLASPSTTQTTCTSTVNGFNLNLTFTPSGAPAPNYTITWSSIPNGVNSPTQISAIGGIAPGGYTATILTSTGCQTVVSFTIDPRPSPATFNIVPALPYVVNCYNPVLTITLNPATNNYTVTNGIAAAQFTNTPAFTFTNAFGTYSAIAVNPVSGCTSTQTFVVTQNTVTPTSAVTPTFQNITCSITSIQTVTGTASPTVNISQQWISPFGGTLTANTSTDYFLPGIPGTYTHCVVNTVNGCSTCKTFTVFSTSGFPTFSVSSPQNFTLGCTTKSVANINITNAQTTPTAGGPVSYTIMGPGTGSVTPPGTLSPQSSYTVNAPGNWTVVTKDNTNLCESKIYVSVIANTVAPGIDSVIIPRNILDCNVSSALLEGVSLTPNVSYQWSFPGTPGSVSSSSLNVVTKTLVTTQTLIANYTLTIMDNNNTCRSSTIVPMYQNLFPPKAAITGDSRVTCKTTTVTLTNNSSTNIPPFFNPSLPVVGYIWSGPTPQPTLQVSSTYVGAMPGEYTLVAKDLNNGCTAIATKTIEDGRDYPFVNKPSAPDPFVLDCGSASVKISPILSLTNTAFTYSWEAVPGATVSGANTPTLTTNLTGQYVIIVTNEDNGCVSDGVVQVVDGKLEGGFIPDPENGFAPLSVSFTNTSHSTLGNNNITSLWSFGNGISQMTYSASVSPVTVYSQAGTYTVTMYVAKGNCLDTVVKVINVELPSGLVIPNIFTPNGDKVNDEFFVKSTSLVQIDIMIVDRWGHKVYELSSDKGNIAWDGKNQVGREVPDGVYFYMLKARGRDGRDFDHKGTVTVMR